MDISLLHVFFFLSIFGIIHGDIGPRNPILETVSFLNDIKDGKGKVRVSLTQTQLLIDTVWSRAGCGRDLDPVLCKKCLQAEELFDIVGANMTTGLDEEAFQRASVVLLYHLENAICKTPEEMAGTYIYNDYIYDLVTTTQLDVTQTVIGRIRAGKAGGMLADLFPSPIKRDHRFVGSPGQIRNPTNIQSIMSLPVDLSFVEEQLDYILHLISQTYKATTQYKCFTAADVFEEAGLEPNQEAAIDDIEKLSSIVITNILHGYCIGKSKLVSPDDFIRAVFEDYGTFGRILKQDFTKLLADLKLGPDHPGGTFHAAAVVPHQLHDPDSWQGITPVELKHGREKRAVGGAVMPPAGLQEPPQQQIKHSGCFSPEELFQIFDNHESVSVSKFYEMCPALIQQLTSHTCKDAHGLNFNNHSAMTYGWGTLAVFLVTLGSMIGIVIVPLAGARVYTGLMHLLIALAVSTLSGDALLHLIPEAMGIHVHGVDQPASPKEILNKVILVVAAVYLFFLFERLMVVCLGRAPLTHSRQSLNKLEGFGFGEGNYGPNSFTAGNSFEVIDDIQDIPDFTDFDNLEKYSLPPTDAPKEKTGTENKDETNVDIDPDTTVSSKVHKSSNNAGPYLTDTLECRILEESKKAMMESMGHSSSFGMFRGMQTTSVLVLVGDAIHNFADGIAIGVGFTLDGYVGSSITIAVFCHELPHEIGDFAVLLKHGMSFRTAFCWSLVSNLFGFLGLYVGIALGTNQMLHQWIFAATAGLFLYISLVDLMPEITHDPNGFNVPAFFMHNLGLLLGWTLMLILAYFEDEMKAQ